MQAIKKICDVNDEGRIIIDVPEYSGNKVEVIILKKDELNFDTELALTKLQEATGFARNVLNDPKEDVWNEL
ncbi:hypothetical protein KA005_74940 [bacterium]|jgi:hypothetical protein|nr:hypothetical protein [bacterium]